MVYLELAATVGFIALTTFTICSILNIRLAGACRYSTGIFRYLIAVAILAATILTTVAKIIAIIAETLSNDDDQIGFASGVGGVYNHLTGQFEEPRGQLGVYDEDLNDYV